MPYRRVAFVQGHYYHVYNRGSGRQPIFFDDENYVFVLRAIKKYAQELQISVIAYCLMPNHYHLLLRQDGDKPAGLVPQRVFNSYTKAFNKRYQRSGTLFEGRFKAIHIDQESYLLHLCRYIHANPVTSGLTSQPEEWPYSNYHEWIGIRNGSLIDHLLVRAHFSDTQAYSQFVRDYLTESDGPPEDIQAYLLEQ